MKNRDIINGLTHVASVHTVKTRFHLEIKDKDKLDNEVKSQLEDIVRTKNHFYKNGYYTFFNNNGDESTVKLTKDRYYSVKNNKMILDVLYVAEPQEGLDIEKSMNQYHQEVKRNAQIVQNALLNNTNDNSKNLFGEAINPFTTFLPSDSSSSSETSDYISPPISYESDEEGESEDPKKPTTINRYTL